MRLDCIVADVTNKSRNEAVLYIKSKEVKVNHFIEQKVDTKLVLGDLISVKGFGRFKISSEGTKTKSGRLNLEISIYN